MGSGFSSENQGHRAEDASIRYFKMALKEDFEAMKKTVVPGSLTDKDKEVILDNCFYTMNKMMMSVYTHYLLLFPSYQVIIGKLIYFILDMGKQR
jgi:hypothetical protein